MDNEKELLIKSLYEQGINIKSIKEQTHCSNDTINKIRDKYNLPKRGRNFKTEALDASLVVELYTSGVKTSDICKKCRCSTNTISKVLKEAGVPQRTEGKLKKNKDLFKFYDLTSEETQYWIGYICADGNIQYDLKNKNYRVSLFSKDQEVIDNYIGYFGENNICTFTMPNGVIDAYINSKTLCEYFMNTLNIVPNKSLVLDPHVEYTRSFILGYFDGDGCIRNSNEKQTRYECNITSGSKIFIDKVKNILDENGIYSIIYKHTDCNAYKIRIDRKEDSRKFYKWLYKDHVKCLSRKLNNFAALFGNLGETTSDELLEQ